MIHCHFYRLKIVTFYGKQRHKYVRNRQEMVALDKTWKFLVSNFEAFIWLAAIIYFAVSPVQLENHFTICPLSLAGFEHCPGCGLGRSIILFLHGRVNESWSMHPLGIPAVSILLIRIVTIIRNYSHRQKLITLSGLAE